MMNLKKLFERLIILSYAVIMLYIVFSGLIGKFVHPRIIPYIIICSMVLLTFLIVDMKTKKVVSESKFNKLDILYVLPIVFIFFINGGNLSANIINNKGIDIGKSSSQSSNTNQVDTPETKVETKNIVINGANYVQTVIDISEDLDSFVGSEISLIGFVYRDDTVPSGDIVVGRLNISCCTADAQLFGYLCKYTNSVELKDEEWVRISAIIETKIFEGKKIPYLNVTKLEKINPPKVEYVY